MRVTQVHPHVGQEHVLREGHGVHPAGEDDVSLQIQFADEPRQVIVLAMAADEQIDGLWMVLPEPRKGAEARAQPLVGDEQPEGGHHEAPLHPPTSKRLGVLPEL